MAKFPVCGVTVFAFFTVFVVNKISELLRFIVVFLSPVAVKHFRKQSPFDDTLLDLLTSWAVS